MEPIFCLLVGLFFAAAIYLMMSNHLVRILLGVSIFGNAVNLLIFTSGRLIGPAPPVLANSGSIHGAPSGETAVDDAVAAEVAREAAEATTSASQVSSGAADAAVAAAAHTGGGAAQSGPLLSASPSTEPITPAGPALAGVSDAAENVLHSLDQIAATTANPLPQALILTAIVISFSIFAFLLVLAFRAFQALDTDNVDQMQVAEGAPARPPLGY